MKFGLREIVFVAMLMIIPVGAWALAFRPQNAQNARMMKEIEAKQGKLRALNRTTGQIGDLKKEIASLEQAVRFFQAKLPSEKEIDKVLQEVWRIAENNQLITKSIRTLDRTPGAAAGVSSQNAEYAEQPIAMQLQGDFKGFYAFLLALENQPRIMRISQMKIEKSEKGAEGEVKADFVMSIYFEQAPKETPCPPKI